MSKCQFCKDYENCLAPEHCESYPRIVQAVAWQIAKDSGYLNWTHGLREASEFMEEREMESRLEKTI
jgi:hypothetical protein